MPSDPASLAAMYEVQSAAAPRFPREIPPSSELGDRARLALLAGLFGLFVAGTVITVLAQGWDERTAGAREAFSSTQRDMEGGGD